MEFPSPPGSSLLRHAPEPAVAHQISERNAPCVTPKHSPMYLVGYGHHQKTEWHLCEGSEVLQRFESPAIEPNTLRQGEIVNLLRPLLMKELGPVHPDKIYFYNPGMDDTAQASKVNGAFVQINPRVNLELNSPIDGVCRLLNKTSGFLIWMGRPWLAGWFHKDQNCQLQALEVTDDLPWAEPSDSQVRLRALNFVETAVDALMKLAPVPPKTQVDLIGEMSPWQYRLIREVLHDHDLFPGLHIRRFFPALLAFHQDAALRMGL